MLLFTLDLLRKKINLDEWLFFFLHLMTFSYYKPISHGITLDTKVCVLLFYHLFC